MPDTSVVRTGLSLVLSRTFDAPVARLWQCWTRPDVMARWWGPHGMRATATLDVRPGGAFSLVMHAADGADYPMRGEYLEVVENQRLVMEMHLDDHPASWHDYLAEQFTKAGGAEDTLPSLTVTTVVTFAADSPGTTLLTVEQVFATQAEREAFDGMGSADGWRQSFEKLDKCLTDLS